MTRFGAAAVRAVGSILEHGRADLQRQARRLGAPAVEQLVAFWEALPASSRRYLSTTVANAAAAALLEVVRRAADDETTDRVPTPACPNCGVKVTRRCGACGWADVEDR